MKKNKLKFFSLLIILLTSSSIGNVSSVLKTESATGKKVSAETQSLMNNSFLKTNASTSTFEESTQPNRTLLPKNSVVDAKNPKDFGWQKSIGNITLSDKKITAIQDGKIIGSYDLSDTGVQSALYAMYSAADAANSDFVLYYGGNLTLKNSVLKAEVETPSTTSMTFSTLKGHAKSLTWVSNSADLLTSSTSAQATGTNYTVTLPQNSYFGVPTIFRNVTVAASGDNIYAQGNAFATTNGSWITGAPNLYGGTDNTDISGDTNIYIGAMGNTNGWDIYGGNTSGGTITGNTHVTIAQSSRTIAIASGGSAAGSTILGNTYLDISDNIASEVTNIYGGGVGTSTSPVNVTGNVTTYVSSNNPNARYQLYQGGIVYGNISGSIYNTLSGQGGWTSRSSNINGTNNLSASTYNGGSYQGSIGIQGASAVISNSYDTSAFSTGQALFTGGNGGTAASYSAASSTKQAAQGLIYANITNYIKSAFSTGTNGAIYGVVGGNGHDSLKISPAQWGLGTSTNLDAFVSVSDSKEYAKKPSSTVVSNAQKITSNAIYGNIYTWLQSGVMSTVTWGGLKDYQGYSYGASSNGYLEGKSVLEAGTANDDHSVGGTGVVYCSAMGGSAVKALAAHSKVAYGKTDLSSAQNSGWDLFGGGGTVWNYKQAFLQNGDSYLVQNNVLARWTYGGQSNGSQVGDSYNISNGAIVDTIEGGGFEATTRWGSTESHVNQGQINWFLTGGSWGDLYTTKNTNLYVHDGTVNAIVGGNYGQSGTEVIAGDTSVNVYGGDFSGKPRTGTKKLCGGVFYDGRSSILGSTTLNIDLSDNSTDHFSLPTSTYLSGGSGYNNSNPVTGSGESSSINLIIKDKDSNTKDVFNNAIVYGDGTKTATNTNIGTINISIDAPGGTFGSVYSTNYDGLSAKTGLLYDTNIDIGDGTSVKGNVAVGDNNDDLTDAVSSVNSKQSNVTIGNQTNKQPVTIEGALYNFTNLTVSNGSTLDVKGVVSNGRQATAANHAKTYSQHGNLNLEDDAKILITSNNSLISASKMTVGNNVILGTAYDINKEGLINISDLSFSSNGNIAWEPTGTLPSNIDKSYNGTFWGTQKAFPLLTFNGGSAANKSGASSITPSNLSAVDRKNNYAFVGDYTKDSQSTPSSSTWIGYVLPGNIREYKTQGDDNSGFWQHHLSNISTGSLTLSNGEKGWASVKANTDSREIKVMYVNGYENTTTPPFTFTSKAPYYINEKNITKYNGEVISNEKYPTTFDEQGNGGAKRILESSDYFDNSSDQGFYGNYIIQTISTSKATTLEASNYILPTSRAKTLTEDELKQIVNLNGQGVASELKISDNAITEINQAGNQVKEPTTPTSNVSGQAYQNIEITWTLGEVRKETNIVVVPDNSQISSDGQYALNVSQNIEMTIDQANQLQDQNQFDGNWSYALGFKSDGTVVEPQIQSPENLISILKTVKSGDYEGNMILVTYSYQGLTKNTTLSLSGGSISLSTPTSFNFGLLKISPTNIVAWPGYDENIVVHDSRTGSDLKPWNLSVSQTTETTESNPLLTSLYYTDNNNNTRLITTSALNVYENDEPSRGDFEIDQNWNSDSKKGIHLDVPVAQQRAGTYQGELTWTLNNIPGN